MNRTILGAALFTALFATAALADETSLLNDMDMKPLSAQESAQLKADRDAAKAKWAAMTPEQKDAARKAAANKRLGDQTALDRIAQNDDMQTMTKSESAQMKAEREAAKAKWDAMTPEQKAAARKAMQQKRMSEMNAMERVGQDSDMGRYMAK
jgi:hypothetical protein